MKNKQTAQGQLQEYREAIREEFGHWKHINQNGCNDPFWEDGFNMNLVRNHIVYYKNLIAQTCEENRLALPEEYYIPSPPEVDNEYMANLNQKERVQRLKQGGSKLATGKIKYDDMQLSLF